MSRFNGCPNAYLKAKLEHDLQIEGPLLQLAKALYVHSSRFVLQYQSEDHFLDEAQLLF